ncbi:MAG: hypothetical protein H7X95_14370, partial [Deltaproteobacteria bacterium]|nr:hypothetical protein [Deltaproteobacteria bacterium]
KSGVEGVGAVELAIRLSENVNLARVDYRISGNGIDPVMGTIAVNSAAATASALVGGISPASGYRVEMTAASSDGRTTCAGRGNFDVQVGQSSSVSVLIQCRTMPDTGGVVVGGTINNCPRVTSLAASQVSASVGGLINVSAVATDLDPADVLTVAWTATSGSFLRPSSPETSFRCSVPGSPVLTVTASDGQCNDAVSVTLTCLAGTCGNNTIDPGEQCDPPVGGACSTTCQRIAVCGNAILERMEQCDPPNGTTCDSLCRAIPAPIGDAGADGV